MYVTIDPYGTFYDFNVVIDHHVTFYDFHVFCMAVNPVMQIADKRIRNLNAKASKLARNTANNQNADEFTRESQVRHHAVQFNWTWVVLLPATTAVFNYFLRANLYQSA